MPEHVLEKHLGNEPSTPTHEAEQQSDDPRRSLIPRRVPLQVLSEHSLRALRGKQPLEHGFVESSDKSFAWLAQAVRSIAAGGQHTVAVTDTSVHTWGSNSCGQLGTRTFRDKGSPTEVKDLTGKGVCQVACGLEHTLFLCGYGTNCCCPPSRCTPFGVGLSATFA